MQACRRRVIAARARGVPAYGETCIQYLFASIDDLRRPNFEGARYVCSPPLRDAANQPHMWDALNFDHLQSISTDHCPFTDEQKRLGLGDFSKIPNGLAAIQHRLPLLWEHGVKTGRMTPNRFVEVTSTAIAKIFGLYPNKGTIAPGADADIVIFDPEREHVFSTDTSFMNVDYDLWAGQKVSGSPRQTLSRGTVVFDDGKILTRPGHGRFVKRSVFSPVRGVRRVKGAMPRRSPSRRTSGVLAVALLLAAAAALPLHAREGVAEAASPLPPAPSGALLARLRAVLPMPAGSTAPRRGRWTSTSTRTRSTTATRRTLRDLPLAASGQAPNSPMMTEFFAGGFVPAGRGTSLGRRRGNVVVVVGRSEARGGVTAACARCATSAALPVERVRAGAVLLSLAGTGVSDLLWVRGRALVRATAGIRGGSIERRPRAGRGRSTPSAEPYRRHRARRE